MVSLVPAQLSICARTLHCSCDRQQEKRSVHTKSNPLDLNVHLFLPLRVQVLLPVSSHKHSHTMDCLLLLLTVISPGAYWLSMHTHCHMVVCVPVFPSVGQLTTQLVMPQQREFPWQRMRQRCLDQQMSLATILFDVLHTSHVTPKLLVIAHKRISCYGLWAQVYKFICHIKDIFSYIITSTDDKFGLILMTDINFWINWDEDNIDLQLKWWLKQCPRYQYVNLYICIIGFFGHLGGSHCLLMKLICLKC